MSSEDSWKISKKPRQFLQAQYFSPGARHQNQETVGLERNRGSDKYVKSHEPQAHTFHLRVLLFRQMNFFSLKNPVIGALWFHTVLMKKVSAVSQFGVPPRGEVKYLQPRACVPRSLPRRGLRSRLQNLRRAWQRVGLPTPHRGVPGRAGGGGGAQHPAVGVHGSVR